MIEGRRWKFSVSAETGVNELVCIVGSCPELGDWDPSRIQPLKPDKGDGSQYSQFSQNSAEDMTTHKWSIDLQIPMTKMEYRYCVAVKANETVFAIRRWETHFKPRSIQHGTQQITDEVSQFGFICGQKRVEAGWLVYDTAVQLKLYNSKNHPNPIVLWKKKHKDRKIRVKVTPVPLGVDGVGVEDSTDVGADSRPVVTSVPWPLMEVAVMKEGQCMFKPPGQFGICFNEDDFTVFQCRLLQLNSTAYLVDFYVDDTAGAGDIPLYIGCCYLLPSNLVSNFGVATIPITSPRHLPIGQFTVHYMVVKPMSLGLSDMSASFTRYWKESWKGLEVGHRGAGNSYHAQPKSCATIRENTVASLKYAADNGADMVEIDVQLSRDLVPVIYHDFHACIALKRKKDQNQSDLLEIPIKDLTLQQLHALKVFHRKEKGLNRFSDDELEDHQPFPTLEQALKAVPYTCGFNIEVKWTMLLKDGTYELLHPFELNHFMDLIIKMVLEHGGRRKIVFSCFHPDLCTMLRLKQNRYPVLFLTQGMSENWPPYDDSRCQSIRQAVLYATTADILGINLHTEDLLNDASQMTLAQQHDLVVFCWGDHNNDKDTIVFLKKLGMHAIIYDKIDVYNSKTHKESIFMCEERQSLQQQQQQQQQQALSVTSSNIRDTLGSAGSLVDSGASSSGESSPVPSTTNLSAMLALATSDE